MITYDNDRGGYPTFSLVPRFVSSQTNFKPSLKACYSTNEIIFILFSMKDQNRSKQCCKYCVMQNIWKILENIDKLKKTQKYLIFGL